MPTGAQSDAHSTPRAASSSTIPHWGTADAEINVPTVENLELSRHGALSIKTTRLIRNGNPELTNVLPLKSGVRQNTPTHSSPTARTFVLVLISTFPVYSPTFFQDSLITF